MDPRSACVWERDGSSADDSTSAESEGSESLQDNSSARASLKWFSSRFEFTDSVVLVNIPQVPIDQIDRQVARNRGYFAYPPMGLLYLSSTLRERGVHCEIIDLNFVVLKAARTGVADLDLAWMEAINDAVSRNLNPVVGISFMFEATRRAFEAVCHHIRGRFPRQCIAAGGVSATGSSTEIVSSGLADVVFMNEGEKTVGQFYDYLDGKQSEPPSNLVFLSKDGETCSTGSVPGGPVDCDIRPELNKIPVAEYHSVGCLSNFSRMVGLNVPFFTVIAKRGCRARCAFCGVRFFNGKGLRLRSPATVVDEMVYLHDKYGIRHFDWLDDDLLWDSKSILLILEEIERRLPGISWAANNGLIASAVTDDLLARIASSGCVGFKVGLESGNPTMLRRVRKPTTVPRFLEFAARAKRYREVFVSVNFILGLPEETLGMMFDSMAVAVQSNLHWHNFYIYQHLKNTEFYIAYGGLGTAVLEHGRDGEQPAFGTPSTGDREASFINPVRDGQFGNLRERGDVPTGYDVFCEDPAEVPPREWINEIWFSVNTVTNFILNPCIDGNSEEMLTQMIRWLEVLAEAYPEDAMMRALQYYLMDRLGAFSPRELERVRSRSLELSSTRYWSHRERQFGFCSFLDLEPPSLPPRLGYLRETLSEPSCGSGS